MENAKKIWDETFQESSREELGWYEEVPEPSLSLIKKYLPAKEKLIIDAGCGRGTLISHLVREGYKNIIGLDLSSEAIKLLEKDLEEREEKSDSISFMVGDLSEEINFSRQGNLWHDRAVFHFLLKKEEREGYKNNLLRFLEPGGIFIIACFHHENKAEMCNGFPVKKTDREELVEFFREEFLPLEDCLYDYTMPWGENRKFLYLVFRRK